MTSSRRKATALAVAVLLLGAVACTRTPDPVEPPTEDGGGRGSLGDDPGVADTTAPVVTIVSGCGALYPEGSPLVMTCDAFDLGPGGGTTSRVGLAYSYVLYPVWGTSDCPEFWVGESAWERFPQDGMPVRLVFEDLGGRTWSGAERGERVCEWFFSFAVRDPSGNVGSDRCRVMILR